MKKKKEWKGTVRIININNNKKIKKIWKSTIFLSFTSLSQTKTNMNAEKSPPIRVLHWFSLYHYSISNSIFKQTQTTPTKTGDLLPISPLLLLLYVFSLSNGLLFLTLTFKSSLVFTPKEFWSTFCVFLFFFIKILGIGFLRPSIYISGSSCIWASNNLCVFWKRSFLF